eukprot:COSAG01_NODE_15200_length_1362_cov_2.224070_2_plen_204_part_00
MRAASAARRARRRQRCAGWWRRARARSRARSSHDRGRASPRACEMPGAGRPVRTAQHGTRCVILNLQRRTWRVEGNLSQLHELRCVMAAADLCRIVRARWYHQRHTRPCIGPTTMQHDHTVSQATRSMASTAAAFVSQRAGPAGERGERGGVQSMLRTVEAEGGERQRRRHVGALGEAARLIRTAATPVDRGQGTADAPSPGT